MYYSIHDIHVPCMLSKSSIPSDVSSVAIPEMQVYVQKSTNHGIGYIQACSHVPSVLGASEVRLRES